MVKIGPVVLEKKMHTARRTQPIAKGHLSDSCDLIKWQRERERERERDLIKWQREPKIEREKCFLNSKLQGPRATVTSHRV